MGKKYVRCLCVIVRLWKIRAQCYENIFGSNSKLPHIHEECTHKSHEKCASMCINVDLISILLNMR